MKPRPSFVKKQREQAKRDKRALKAEKKAQRKTDDGGPEMDTEVIRETEIVETAEVAEEP